MHHALWAPNSPALPIGIKIMRFARPTSTGEMQNRFFAIQVENVARM